MSIRVVKRAYKYRFYLSPEQADLLNRTFGSVRYVYNRALAERSRAWTQEHKRVTFAETCRMLTAWKNDPDTAWLYEVSNVQQGLQHLQNAYASFWGKRARYPAFKSRHKSRASATFTTSGFRYRDGQITLAKMSTPLDIRWSRPLPSGAEPSTVTVSRDAAGRWHISILVDCPVGPLPAAATAVGVDAGITSLVTLSTGEKVTNPRHERRDRARLAKAQRALSRKQQGSANRGKARVKVARVHPDHRPPPRRAPQAFDSARPREPNGRDRGSVRPQHGPQPHPGPRDLRRLLGGAAAAAGVQGGLVRADRDRGGPVLPEQQDVLGVRGDHREDATVRPGVGVHRVWCAARPGRERGEGSTGGRAGRCSLRRWCETAPHIVHGGDRQ